MLDLEHPLTADTKLSTKRMFKPDIGEFGPKVGLSLTDIYCINKIYILTTKKYKGKEKHVLWFLNV